jgi:D-alanyl-D-alanine carboxypeptidase/D-alanyl-D-alanine-endopeptidase (penicillin-binding protein 4)
MKLTSLLIYLIVFLQIQNSFVFSQNELENIKNQIVNDPLLSNASVGICVIDVKTGEKIVQNQAKTSLSPASTTKLFSTATAFEILGENYHTETKLYTTSEISAKGIVTGDLWIRGGGDVTLGSKYYNESGSESSFLAKWADSLYKLGLRKIEGNVIGDASEFGYRGAPDGWTWNDMGNYYGAGPSGLPIFDNMLRYYFKINGIGTKPELLKTFPIVENFNFNNYIEGSSSTGDNSYIYGAPYSLDRFGTGYLEANSNITVKGSIPDPELQFAIELKNALIARGIEVTGKAKNARNMQLESAWKRYSVGHFLIYKHKSPTVASIAYWTNLKSVNLFAEELVCWIGFHKNGNGSTENGINYVDKFWDSRINTAGLFLKDGSGLSRTNAISAEHFCELLKHMHHSKNAAAFKKTLAIAGETGTMADICKNQAGEGRVKAKSGTMSKVKSYAGYVTTKSGKELAFAFIFNNYNCTNSALILKIEKLMNTMAVM